MESHDAEFSDHGRTAKRIAFIVTQGSKSRRILAHNASDALRLFEKDVDPNPTVPISVRRARKGE